ncbi:MAG: T9SS type A sorting domain-containing protein [bacterium]|nr:T9SS type A sorting domain-containing protein [bacterium]
MRNVIYCLVVCVFLTQACFYSVGATEINWTKHTIDNSFGGALCITSADLDNDGDNDIIAGANYDGIAWWENTGNYNFTKHVIDGGFDGARRIISIDLDNDEDLDILCGAYAINDIAWWENDGNKNFTKHTLETSYDALGIYAADVDSDGDIDILGASCDTDEITWWKNDGDQNFERLIIDEGFDGARDVCAIDIDGDNDVDVVGAAQYSNNIAWWENDGNENFSKHEIDVGFGGARDVYALDLDNDNDVDILGAAVMDDDIAWWENDGSQNFTKHFIDSEFGGANDVFAIDVDGDLDIDILGASLYGYEIVWWENDGNMIFSKHTITDAFNGAFGVYASDLDKDYDVDILGAASYANDIAWWESDLDQVFFSLFYNPYDFVQVIPKDSTGWSSFDIVSADTFGYAKPLCDSSWVSFDIDSVYLSPWDTMAILTSFNTIGLAPNNTYQTQIYFESNAPGLESAFIPVEISLISLFELSFDSTDYIFWIEGDSTVSRTFGLYSFGADGYIKPHCDSSWVTFNPDSINLTHSDTTEIVVTFDATGLDYFLTFETEIYFESNCSGLEDAIIPVVMTTSPVNDGYWFVSLAGNDSTGDGKPDNPFRTIQRGIDVAAPGDEVIVWPGEYAEHITITKSIILSSEDGPEVTSITKETGGTCIITCEDAADLVIKGFTVYGGVVSGNQAAGAGIKAINSNLTIRNNIIESNRICSSSEPSGWSRGAGVYASGGDSIIIKNNIIQLNTGSGFYGEEPAGNGIYIQNYNWAIVDSNTIIENSGWGDGGRGGGVCIQADSIELSYNTISDNSTGSGNRGGWGAHGGGAYLMGYAEIEWNTITGNQASCSHWWPTGSSLSQGGGIYMVCSGYFKNNIITDNSAVAYTWSADFMHGSGTSKGGGINGTISDFKANTISNNISNSIETSSFDEMLYDFCRDHFNNDTSFINDVWFLPPDGGNPESSEYTTGYAYGGGLYWSDYTPQFSENIFCNNVATGNCLAQDIDGGGIYCDPCDFVNYSDFYINLPENDFTGIRGNIQEDPLFIGGTAFDYHLTEFSSCIDAGDPNSPPDPDGTIADMGAFYYHHSVISIGMEPDDQPTMVVAGEEFIYTGILINHLTDSSATDVWIKVHLEDEYIPIRHWNDVAMDIGINNYYPVTQFVPQSAAAGDYYYIAYCGEYDTQMMIDSCYFSMTVISSNNNLGGAQSWDAFGWGDETRDDGLQKSKLLGSFPNPFNAQAKISFYLQKPGNASLKIYNIAGQLVKEFKNDYSDAGVYSITWDASSVASGIYFYKLSVGDQVFKKKMMLLK